MFILWLCRRFNVENIIETFLFGCNFRHIYRFASSRNSFDHVQFVQKSLHRVVLEKSAVIYSCFYYDIYVRDRNSTNSLVSKHFSEGVYILACSVFSCSHLWENRSSVTPIFSLIASSRLVAPQKSLLLFVDGTGPVFICSFFARTVFSTCFSFGTNFRCSFFRCRSVCKNRASFSHPGRDSPYRS